MTPGTALISGAGIAGPATAVWLNAAGWKTIVVERAERPRDGGYVIDFWGLGYDLAERMGLGPDMARLGYKMTELRIVGDRGQRLAGFGAGVFQALTDGRFVTLARRDLSRLLLTKAASASEIVYGEEIAALEPLDHRVRARLSGGSSLDVDLVVGADGLHSRVRRLAFGPDDRFERSLGYAVAAFEVAGYPRRDPDVYMLHGRPGRMIGRFTLHENRSVFLFVFAFAGALPETAARQKALLRSLYGGDEWESAEILRCLDETQDLYLDRVSQIVAPSWSSGRVVLVGDAAFCPSLLAGQGSALAMIAAYVLAGEIATSESLEPALAAYERRLRAFMEMKQGGAARFAGALAPRTAFGLWFRNLMIRAFALPGLARAAFGGEILDRLPLPDYPLHP